MPVTLKHLRDKGYSSDPKTLSEHLLKRRREQALTQAQVARELGTDEWTVGNWEKGKTAPAIRFFPALLRFLGYDPFPEPRTLPEKLKAKRRALGLSVEAAAKLVGVDEGTFGNWEAGRRKPKQSAALERFFATSSR